MWYRKPTDELALQSAAARELDNTLAAISCAVVLLRDCADVRTRELAAAIHVQQSRAAKAACILARSGHDID